MMRSKLIMNPPKNALLKNKHYPVIVNRIGGHLFAHEGGETWPTITRSKRTSLHLKIDGWAAACLSEASSAAQDKNARGL